MVWCLPVGIVGKIVNLGAVHHDGEREIEWVFLQERAPKSGPETGSLVAAVWPSNWDSLAARIEPALAAGRLSGRRKPKNAACSRREST